MAASPAPLPFVLRQARPTAHRAIDEATGLLIGVNAERGRRPEDTPEAAAALLARVRDVRKALQRAESALSHRAGGV